jgi:hypothetical protein
VKLFDLTNKNTNYERFVRTINIAGNPNTPAATIRYHAENSNRWIVQRVALRNIKCPPEIVAKHAEDTTNATVTRIAALSNPVCDPAVLSAVILNPTETHDLRATAVTNPNAPNEALCIIITDPKPNITLVYAALSNPACPPAALWNWAKRGNLPLEVVKRNPAWVSIFDLPYLVDDFTDCPLNVLLFLGSNPATPGGVLEELPWDKSPVIAAAVVGNKNTPLSVTVAAALLA